MPAGNLTDRQPAFRDRHSMFPPPSPAARSGHVRPPPGDLKSSSLPEARWDIRVVQSWKTEEHDALRDSGWEPFGLDAAGSTHYRRMRDDAVVGAIVADFDTPKFTTLRTVAPNWRLLRPLQKLGPTQKWPRIVMLWRPRTPYTLSWIRDVLPWHLEAGGVIEWLV